MKIKDLSITFQTPKIKECVAFYVKYFQAQVTFDASWYVTILLESDCQPPLYLSFQSEGSEQTFRGGLTLNFLVEDVDHCYEALVGAKIALAEEIADHEWGDRAFSVLDPIGNLVYIYSERPLHEKYQDAVKANR